MFIVVDVVIFVEDTLLREYLAILLVCKCENVYMILILFGALLCYGAHSINILKLVGRCV